MRFEVVKFFHDFLSIELNVEHNACNSSIEIASIYSFFNSGLSRHKIFTLRQSLEDAIEKQLVLRTIGVN